MRAFAGWIRDPSKGKTGLRLIGVVTFGRQGYADRVSLGELKRMQLSLEDVRRYSKQFTRSLGELKPNTAPSKWIFIPYDQLSDKLGPLAEGDSKDLGIILIENHAMLSRRPFHKQKLAYLVANMRHFALEQARRGVAVDYHFAKSSFRKVLERCAKKKGRIWTMEPPERSLRIEINPLVDSGVIRLLPHEGWLTSTRDFCSSQSNKPPWRMDVFYRYVRKKYGVLMESGKPVGGKFSFDAENRLSWAGDPPAPDLPEFPDDPIKREVGELIGDLFGKHPGTLDLKALPVTQKDASFLWNWAKTECLAHFGPYEDAMSRRSSNLFHTRVSSLLNLHRLLPIQLVQEVCQSDIPLNSKEGFVRQILGWREFMRHVHSATDGFRKIPGKVISVSSRIGDAGYSRWTGGKWEAPSSDPNLDGGATPSELGASNRVPPAFWGASSGLDCLDSVISDVWNEGYSHHITRLMILSNIATLLDVSPRQLADWFWVAYTDAYDWVVEPNVLGMGTFALGDLFTTKPYVSGAAYISRMSDYCSSCQFDPRKTCPIARLYWAFLARHKNSLNSNPRLRPIMRSLSRRSNDQLKADKDCFEKTLKLLQQGHPMMAN
jgi:deoxyribodipyrimidine photolyase-related protein